MRDDLMSDAEHVSGNTDDDLEALRERVEEVLNLIRPAIQSDGGDVELVDITGDGIVSVRFHGACATCPSSNITLQVGIERQLKDRIPGVTRVQAIA
jgi:Fe-S cluster biogenesis protein NfuA